MTLKDTIAAGRPAGAAPAVLSGTCFCGEVGICVSGAPVEMGYCHCASCRTYSGAPFVTYALFTEDQFTVTAGMDLLGSCNKTGMSARRFCLRCGGHVMTEHPGMGFTDIHAPILPDLHFRPVWHLNYAEAVLPVRDGLPKLRDFPAHAGGSGERLTE
ncbi:Glutathione-dependent formaldehyde-activating enzyme [Defluviimonas aquaemixtae]|uniref:Glutathione-dependent formaldehyde-activating enzyme n=1 Tax=Albidovulum aquaemixtae TaxID=1542388 RepID=A0A2R8BKU7_9RHOB|nr:GFA family protein [Defluviimonas aquaemixtae]SPH24026.1 Glutathione-dependent formaldehyde-activating enzyme [Defluviimonas aquaemixtae]